MCRHLELCLVCTMHIVDSRFDSSMVEAVPKMDATETTYNNPLPEAMGKPRQKEGDGISSTVTQESMMLVDEIIS